ncbi:MAG: cobyrinate a,c-diamide synthase, partial [Chloroflexota bacterium]|nr:cobyrinate a,c-diamide synthase [Chloroflexota bacterium]
LPLVDGLADLVGESCDLDALLALARGAPALDAPAPEALAPPLDGSRPIIAVARDRAFSFYYEDNLDLLRRHGAEVRPFSPLADRALPPGAGAVYLGGGYPELYAAGLAANAPLRRAIREAAERGLPLYAECGGLMYLTEALIDADGARHEMVGLLPGHAVMRERRARLGYAVVRALRDTPLLRAGEEARGHEFHYSTWEGVPDGAPHAYAVRPRRGADGRPEGFARGNVLASYVHLHFWSDPDLARRFVAAAAGAGVIDAPQVAGAGQP